MRPLPAFLVAVALAATAAPAQADDLVDTITHDAAKRTVTAGTATLTAGTRYVLEVSGTKDSMSAQSGLGFRYDAVYCYEGIGFDHPECAHTGPADHSSHSSGFKVGIEGSNAYGAIDSFGSATVDYDPNHSYSVPFVAPSSGKLAVGDDYAFGSCAPGSGCVNATTGSFTVKVFGPAATAAPCAARTALISAAPDCANLPIQLGMPSLLTAEDFGKPADITPGDLPPGTKKLLLDLGVDDPDIQRIVVATLVKLRAKRLGDELSGCVLIGNRLGNYSGGAGALGLVGKNGAVLHACTKFLVQEYERDAGRRTAHAAAGGCEIYFVPLWRKGAKVSERRHRRVLKHAASYLRGSCAGTSNTLRVSLQSHGKGRSLTKLFGGRARTAAVGVAAKGTHVAPGSHLAVSWTAPA